MQPHLAATTLRSADLFMMHALTIITRNGAVRIDDGMVDIPASMSAVRAEPDCNGKVGAVKHGLGGANHAFAFQLGDHHTGEAADATARTPGLFAPELV